MHWKCLRRYGTLRAFCGPRAGGLASLCARLEVNCQQAAVEYDFVMEMTRGGRGIAGLVSCTMQESKLHACA